MVKSRRDENKALTRAAVVDAAAEQFIERGFVQTTIDDVAAAAKVSKGTVYYHFTDKADLFEAVFSDRQARLVDAVVRAVAEGSNDPWTRLRVGVAAYLDRTIEDGDTRALLQAAPAALGAERCREIDEAMGLPVIRTALQELADTGELALPPIEMTARILFAALCEAAMAAGRDPDQQRARNDAAAVLDAVIAGLRVSNAS